MRFPVMIGAVLALALAASAEAQTKASRVYDTSRYVIAFGSDVIPVRSVSGGVVRETTADGTLARRIGSTVIVPLTFESDLQGTLRPWVADSLNRPGTIVRTAELLQVGYGGRVESVRVLRDAVVSRVTFPALDVNARGPAYVTVELRPQEVSEQAGARKTALRASRTVQPLANDFELEIDGLPTQRVLRIEPLTWTLEPATTTMDRSRDAVSRATASIGNLQLVIMESDFLPWRDWHESLVIEGRSGSLDEKSGTLTLLTPDRQRPLLVVELHGLGISSLNRESQPANADTVRTFVAEMYVERISIR